MHVEAENAVMRERARIREEVVNLMTIENTINPQNPLISRADVLDILSGNTPILVSKNATIK